MTMHRDTRYTLINSRDTEYVILHGAYIVYRTNLFTRARDAVWCLPSLLFTSLVDTVACFYDGLPASPSVAYCRLLSENDSL